MVKVALILAQPPRCDDVADMARRAGFDIRKGSATKDALQHFQESLNSSSETLACVVCAMGTCTENSCWPLLEALRGKNTKQVFVIMFSITAARDVKTRFARLVPDCKTHIHP
mmetsp:Transcript_24985/g.54712  ORF Transcript_24985/g.54712 Transcript_24985/m.54712 type:complete len:113 (-) Transcript_24985:2-340(-)